MKRLLTSVLEMVCYECNRLIIVGVSLPMGKSCTYTCKDCKTPLFQLWFSDQSGGEVRWNILQEGNPPGGLRDTRILDV